MMPHVTATPARRATTRRRFNRTADEGGFAPQITGADEGLQLLVEAIAKAGYEGKVKIAMDVAASEFFVEGSGAKGGEYDLGFKSPEAKNVISGAALMAHYEAFIAKYPIVSIEDPFEQDDWANYGKLTAKVGKAVQIVGDDLLVTNPVRRAGAGGGAVAGVQREARVCPGRCHVRARARRPHSRTLRHEHVAPARSAATTRPRSPRPLTLSALLHLDAQKRITQGIASKACNALLLKVNQIGTVSIVYRTAAAARARC